MNFDDFGGETTFCIMESDGTTKTWVEPAAPRQERTWQNVGVAVNIDAAEGTALKLRVHGCGVETFVVSFSGSSVLLEGCGGYNVDFDVMGPSLTIRVSGHGESSCGLIGGMWTFPLDRAIVKTLSLQQHWVDAPLIARVDEPCATSMPYPASRSY